MLLLACGGRGSDAVRGPQQPLRVGTASSLQDSGLCAAVAAEFSARTQLELAATCVGTRDPVATAKDGQVDLLWLQARAHEDAFVADGYREGLELEIWVQGDPRLQSGYGAVAVNPMRVSRTDYAASMAFIEFLTSPPVQALIGEFGRERYGTSLFHPLAAPRSVD